MIKKIMKKILRKPYRYLKEEKEFIIYYFQHKKIQWISKKYHSLPIEKKIVFLNFNGKGYGCNPKYIAEELIKSGFDGELVWLVKEKDRFMPQKIRQVNINKNESFKELATARVIVNNVKGDINLKKRKGQYYIQTWHAGFSPKLLEREAAMTLPKSYLLESKYNSKDTDLFLSNSVAQTEEYKRAFWCRCEILQQGLPRNDIFFKYTSSVTNKIRKKLGVKKQSKVVMYAPTFRGCNDSLEEYGLNFNLLKKAISNKFGGEWTVFVRMHPNISTPICKNSNYIDVSQYPDMQDLLLITDILITDYSSSIFDIIEMDRIIFIYANDIDSYQLLRGLKQEFFDLPFGIADNNESLIENIKNYDEEKYKRAIQSVKNRYCTFDDGNASEKVVEKILEWIKKYE